MTKHHIVLTMPTPKAATVAELYAKYLKDDRVSTGQVLDAMLATEGAAQQHYDELVAHIGGRLAAFDDLMRGWWPEFEAPCAYHAHRDTVELAMDAVENGIREQWSKVSSDFARLVAGQ